MKLSLVIVTWNEQSNISRCLQSAQKYFDEMIVVDMSTDPKDKTKSIAKKIGAKVFTHPYTGYVEPARNFAISKSSNEWIFLLDADEEISSELGQKLISLADSNYDYFHIPRQNIVFNKWLEHSRWWPDYQIRFFKKGSLTWPEEIHSQPQPQGQGQYLTATTSDSIIHHHYSSVSQFVQRLDRYTTHQAQSLSQKGYFFTKADLLRRPANEFFSRFFAGQGYKDGLHGLALALLQSFSELVLYLKLWESSSFPHAQTDDISSLANKQIKQIFSDWMYWQIPLITPKKQLFYRLLRKFLSRM